MNARQTRNRCTLAAIASLPNLFLAAAKAQRGGSCRPDVEEWWLRREVELLALRNSLLNGTYLPDAYHFFEIYEPKRRVIAAAPFRDRVAHHALCNLLAPVLERRFIARSFSCQIGKGTQAARDCCRRLTNRHAFVLKCDVRKFFPNLDHSIRFNKLSEEIHCEEVLDLIRKIILSYRTGADVPAPTFKIRRKLPRGHEESPSAILSANCGATFTSTRWTIGLPRSSGTRLLALHACGIRAHPGAEIILHADGSLTLTGIAPQHPSR